MGNTNDLVLDEHALEESHIPVPAGHAPRLEATEELGGLCIYERDDASTFILAKNPFPVRE